MWVLPAHSPAVAARLESVFDPEQAVRARSAPGGTAPDAVENYTNRSPYPMLHLLREASISEVAGCPSELLEIPKRNQQTLRALGKEKILQRLKAIRDDFGPRP